MPTSSKNTELWENKSANYQAGIQVQRKGIQEQSTKETSIRVQLYLDGEKNGISINTGIQMLNEFLIDFAKSAIISLNIDYNGDLWVDEHHTAEDIVIAFGQFILMALEDKTGLNFMWSCSVPNHKISKVKVTMDLSSCPYFHHDMQLYDNGEKNM